jgi:hypothetical protein
MRSGVGVDDIRQLGVAIRDLGTEVLKPLSGIPRNSRSLSREQSFVGVPADLFGLRASAWPLLESDDRFRQPKSASQSAPIDPNWKWSHLN